jgi:hypothetical protein
MKNIKNNLYEFTSLKTRDGSLTFECRVNPLGFIHTMLMRIKEKKIQTKNESTR